MKGLEPIRPETLDPKSNAATNYATCAGSITGAKLVIFAVGAKFCATILINGLKFVPLQSDYVQLISGWNPAVCFWPSMPIGAGHIN